MQNPQTTSHQIHYKAAQNIHEMPSESIALMITSPPYPMIEMWDEIFARQDSSISSDLIAGGGQRAFEKMHQQLDQIWKEVFRVLVPGGIACINIGDATRTINGNFQLFPSHARIISACQQFGFQNLPEILWRKQTNAPNKFMGSGMLPPGAYVTLEHEYILIFRKGFKREIKTSVEKQIRQQSSYFWEERNTWFSDVWDFKGTPQDLSDKKTRQRSGAYPFELAYRLINMFSIQNDVILDPFLGTGTTMLAAMVSQRNSIGYEIDTHLHTTILERVKQIVPFGNHKIQSRLEAHQAFVKERQIQEKSIKYTNEVYQFPVMTRQEQKLWFKKLVAVKEAPNHKFFVDYNSNRDPP